MDMPTHKRAALSLLSRNLKRPRRSSRIRNKIIARDSSTQDHVTAKNPQAGLSGLPEELVVIIFRHLRTSTLYSTKIDTASLSNVCRVNKRYSHIATEILYEEIDNGSRAISAVANNIPLAKYVKELFLRFEFNQLSREEASRVLENACNVRKLDILAFQMSDLHRLLWVKTLAVAVGSNHFAHLKSLKIFARGMSIEEMSCVFRIRSLKQLELGGCYQHSFNDSMLPARSCDIQCLRLFDSLMDIKAVKTMICAMKALKEFEYFYDTSDWEPLTDEDTPMSRWPEHSWTVLGEALSRHEHSLEILNVADMADPDIVKIVFPNGRELGELGSLQQFLKLSSISAPLDAFLDIEHGDSDLSNRLPKGLTDLTVGFYSRESINAYSEATLGSLQKMSELKSLHLNFMTEVSFREIHLAQALFALRTSGVDVSLEYLNEDLDLDSDDMMDLVVNELG